MPRFRWMFLAALGAALASGCAATYPQIEEPPWIAPSPVTRVGEPRPSPYQSTSLWTDTTPLTSGFQDVRARNLGDLVTVLVLESSVASREASTNVSRNSSVDAEVTAFLGAEANSYGLGNLYGSAGGFKPQVGAATGNSFKGAGSTTRKDELRTRVTARVVNVLDDGNLIIEGRRQVQVNAETQYLFVRGIVRTQDIKPDNTITSVALADAQIIYGGKG
ncbi:MAG: flagellar basal body L-ring protein FlgH, partial [Deferrisomatales bacterium]|nr:flagellar basal body L-ring protein FlgH [Deferrisomatales bacterium]